jgi:phosphoglycerate kinase
MEQPKRPLMAIVGGAKIADKIDVLHRFIEIADFVAVGGAMANTFLAAQGIDIADSLIDKEDLPVAKDIIHKAGIQAQARRFVFAIPYDGVVAHAIDKTLPTRIVDWNAHVIADIENYPKRPPASSSHIHAHEKILDIGPFSGSFIAGAMQLAETVVWNGTMGVTETVGLQGPVGPYAHGTELIGYVEARKLVKSFNHVSTGGGASLELMGGRKLPGVEALLPKETA